jgi:hypothetical protein
MRGCVSGSATVYDVIFSPVGGLVEEYDRQGG